MKLLQWFCVGLLIIGVAAQRRQPQRPESSSVEPSTQRSVRSRGRARFTASSEFEELSNVSDPPVSQQSRQPSRRRLDYERHLEPRQRSPNTTQKPKSNGSYEVKEIIDDIPRENVRRPAPRPRISTETVSSSSAAPKTETPTSSTAREEPSTEAQKLEASTTTEKKETVDSSSIGDSETALPSTTKLFTPEPKPSSSPDTEKKQETTPELDITKEEPKRVLPRAQLKPRVNTMVEEPTEVPKTSSRLRPSRRFDVTPAPEEVPKAETPRSRPYRKRPSFAPLHERKGPSVSSVFSESDHPVRSRTGRKTKPTISRGIDSSVEATTQQRRTGLIEAAPSRRKDTSVAAENQGLNDSPAFSESDHPVRSRTGRKIEPTISRRIDSSVEEISTRIQRRTGIEAAQSRRRETVVAAENQELHDESKIASRRSPKPLARGRTFVKETSEVPPSEGTTARSSIRSRSSKRDHSSATEAPAQKTVVRNSRLRAMPHFDESKLEVLPLFESDAKTEKSTAVDSVPEVSKTTLESTSPLTTSKATEGTTSTETTKSTSKSTEATTKSTGATTKSTEATTTTTSKSRNSTNRRVVSRVPIREVKNNKIDNDPPAGRSSRKHPTTTSRITNSRSHRPRDNKPAAESLKPSSRGRGRHSSDNSESSTTEQSRRKQNRPKKIEPTVPETRLQTLSPRRSRPGSRKEPATTSTTEHSKVETRNHSSNRHATRGSSRFSKVEDELNGEIVAESNLSKSVKNLEESSTIPKRSRNTKRGTTKDHSGLTSSEEAIDESDNYPEPFKALIQAKIKQKETRSRPAEEVVTSSERIVQKNSAPKAQVLPPQSASARELRKDEDNELNALNPSPSPPKTTSRRPTSQSQRVVKTKVEIIESSNNNENKIETQTKPKASTQAPPSTSTTKEVLTSISSKVTRQRFHARFKADSKNRTAAIVNNQDDRNRNSRAKSRNLSPPKAATGLYSSKKSARSTTVAPKHESTTSSHYKRTYTSRINGVVEHVASTTEAPHNAKPKAHRFSSKYRSELLRATGFRASTAPAYVPTVPTVTPHVSGDDNSLQNRNNAVMPQPATPSPSNNMPAQNELNGNSVSTISNIMVQSTTGKVMYKTLQIDPLTNQVKTDRPGGVAAAGNTVFRWKPVTAPPIVEVGNKINSDINVVGSASSTPATNVVAITPSSSTTTQAAQQLATTVVNVMDQMRANLQAAVQVFATTVEPNKMTPSPTTMRPSSPAATPAPSTMMSMARGQSSTTSPPATTMKLATGPTTMAAATMMKLTTTAAPTSMASPMPSPTTAPPMTTKKPPPPPRTTPAPKPTAKSSSSSRTTAASTTTTKLPPPPPTTSALAPPTTLPPPPRTTVAPTTNPPAPTTTPARTTPMPTMPTTPVPTNPPAPPTQAPTTTIKATQVPATTFRATTQVPITTFRATTQVPSTTFRATTPILTTIFKALTQAPTTFRATTHIPTTTFRTMIQVPTTTPSPPPPARSARIRVTTTPQPTTSMRRGSRRRPTTVMTTNPPVTTPVPTTMSPVATMTTVQATTMMMTTTRPPTTTDDVTVTVTPVSIMSPEPSIQISSTTARTISSTLKTLTEEQRKNLETLAELEREQAAILKQLSFLTNLIPGGPRSLGKVPTTPRPSRQSNDIFSSLNPVQSTTKRSITTLNLLEALSPTPKKTDPHQEKLDQLLKQYNLQDVNYTPTTVQTTTKIPLTTKSQQEKLDQILKQYNLESITKKPTSTKSPSTSDSQEEKLEQLLKQYNIQSTATTTKPLTTAKLLESLSQTRSKQTSAEVDSEERVTQVLRQYNLQGVNVKTTPASITLPYGKSNDAILAAILKEQGIRPSTPKINAFEDLHLGRAVPKRTTTTPRPGMIMQGLNWLLNRLAPVQAPRPTSLQIQRPRIIFDHPETNTEEILTRQPTKLTPVLYNTPDPLPSSIIPLPSSTKRPRSLTQDLQQQEQKEVSVLLQQIQAIQKDPEAAQNIVAQFTGRPSATFRPGRRGELSPQELVVLLKEIQEIQNNPSAVKDIQAAIRSESPTTTTTTTTTTTRRPTTTKRSTSKKTLGDLNQEELSILLKQIQTIQQNPEAEQNVDLSKLLEGVRSSTPGYGDDDDEEFMMASPSIKPTRSPRLEPQRINSAQVLGVGGYEKSTSAPKALPPVSFRHVSGIADGDPQLRGRLVTAAVSVTRAISSFLGNAIQALVTRFLRYIGSTDHDRSLREYYNDSLDTPTERVLSAL